MTDHTQPRRSRLIRYLGLLALALALAYAGGVWFFSSVIIKFEVKTLEQDRINRDIGPGAEGMAGFGLPAPVEVRVPGEGVSLAGWLFENPAPRGCAIVLNHGYTGTRYGALDYAPLFWPRGCDMLALDARYHGQSEGQYGTFGAHERDDLVRTVDWLMSERGLRRDQIALVGESMGAAISLQAAAKLPDIAFVVADASYSALADILAHQGQRRYGAIIDVFLPAAITVAGWRADADLFDAAPVRHAGAIQVPVLLVHSRADDFTPWTQSQAIYDAISHPRKALYIVEGEVPHARSVNLRPDQYRRYVSDFLRAYAPEFGSL